MKTYARIQDGRIAELINTDSDIGEMFHRDIAWLEVPSIGEIDVGWEYDGQRFVAPVVHEVAIPTPTIEDLQAQLALLSSRVAMLAGIIKSGS